MTYVDILDVILGVTLCIFYNSVGGIILLENTIDPMIIIGGWL